MATHLSIVLCLLHLPSPVSLHLWFLRPSLPNHLCLGHPRGFFLSNSLYKTSYFHFTSFRSPNTTKLFILFTKTIHLHFTKTTTLGCLYRYLRSPLCLISYCCIEVYNMGHIFFLTLFVRML